MIFYLYIFIWGTLTSTFNRLKRRESVLQKNRKYWKEATSCLVYLYNFMSDDNDNTDRWFWYYEDHSDGKHMDHNIQSFFLLIFLLFIKLS